MSVCACVVFVHNIRPTFPLPHPSRNRSTITVIILSLRLNGTAAKPEKDEGPRVVVLLFAGERTGTKG